MAEDKKEESSKEGGSSNMKMIIIAVVLALVVSGVVVGVVLYMLGDKLEKPATDGEVTEVVEVEQVPAEYMSLDPKFTVTFKNQEHARFMQFSVEIMTREEEAIATLKAHMPAVRSSLVLLFGAQQYEIMSTRDGQEQLLIAITEDINKTLEKITGKAGIDSAYFNSLLIQ